MNAVGSTGVQPCRSVTVEFLALPSMLFNQLSLASYLHILIKLHEMNKKEAFVFFTLFQLWCRIRHTAGPGRAVWSTMLLPSEQPENPVFNTRLSPAADLIHKHPFIVSLI